MTTGPVTLPARPVHAVRGQPHPHSPGRGLGVGQRLQPGCRRRRRPGRPALPGPRRRHRLPRGAGLERRRDHLPARAGARPLAERGLRPVRRRGPARDPGRRHVLPHLLRVGPADGPALPGHRPPTCAPGPSTARCSRTSTPSSPGVTARPGPWSKAGGILAAARGREVPDVLRRGVDLGRDVGGPPALDPDDLATTSRRSWRLGQAPSPTSSSRSAHRRWSRTTG